MCLLAAGTITFSYDSAFNHAIFRRCVFVCFKLGRSLVQDHEVFSLSFLSFAGGCFCVCVFAVVSKVVNIHVAMAYGKSRFICSATHS